jgi:poly(A) polymerase
MTEFPPRDSAEDRDAVDPAAAGTGAGDAGAAPPPAGGPAGEAVAPPPPGPVVGTAGPAAAPPDDDPDSWGNPDGAIPRDLIDTDAVKILRRLKRHGHAAYLVGGGVRDLLLGRTPKDFDVATSAKPEEVRRLFRNCRIIGRRFRLAHVFFREKIIEVSTFRALVDPVSENGDDLLIRTDNVFGSAEQDAVRRDFTVNGLFYDVESGEIIDYVGGRPDLERRVLRTIGDPDIRFREDPIRMLRAVKFAARLGFSLDPGTESALRRHRADILRSAPPRVMEEVLRLLGGGAARPSFRLLAETGALGVLLPELQNVYTLAAEGNAVARYLWGAIEANLGALDAFDRGRRTVSNAVLVGALAMPLLLDRPEGVPAWTPPADLLLDHLDEDDDDETGRRPGAPPRRRRREEGRRPGRRAVHSGVAGEIDGLVSALALRLALSRRDTAALRGALLLLWRMIVQPDPRRTQAIVRRSAFPDALLLLRVRDLACGGGHLEDIAEWERAAAPLLSGGSAPARDDASDGRPRRRRRRRGEKGSGPADVPDRSRPAAEPGQSWTPRDPEAEWIARRNAAAEEQVPTLLIGGPAAASARFEPGPLGAGVGGDDTRGNQAAGRKRRRRRRGRRRPEGDGGRAQ